MVRIREANGDDAAAVCRVHAASIRGLGPRGYDADQVEAWAGDYESADYDHLADDGLRYDTVAVDREADLDGDGKSNEDGDVVGFGTLIPYRRDYLVADPPAHPVGTIEAVYVHPEYAGEGVGSALLRDLEREARDHGLASLGMHASLNAVSFYGHHGYARTTEVRHEFGGDDCDVTGAVVEMWKRLDAN
ncbi:GNAT family N-acetyltransferase [Halobaculum limi]|uniref:GNAT family N-acetyltransferase n=1 Tax=Halobaculum limi TaxID=3031916 RepID=UPI00240688C1|nr:GNAT family N-acetyltransferase [Halobaculum sp. YSMS11]